jgi:extracellular solute-binding protein (family 5)
VTQIRREAVEQFGDLKRPEAVIGTGPWMLERYEPNVRLTFVRNPNYFAPEYGQCVRRLDLDVAKGRKPNLKTQDFTVLFSGVTMMKLDREPFKDVWMRRATAEAGLTRLLMPPIVSGSGITNCEPPSEVDLS